MTSNEATTHVTVSMLALGAIIFVSQGWLGDFKGWVQKRVSPSDTALPLNDASRLGVTPLTDFLTKHKGELSRYKLPLSQNASGQIVDADGNPVQ